MVSGNFSEEKVFGFCLMSILWAHPDVVKGLIAAATAGHEK